MKKRIIEESALKLYDYKKANNGSLSPRDTQRLRLIQRISLLHIIFARKYSSKFYQGHTSS